MFDPSSGSMTPRSTLITSSALGTDPLILQG